MSTSVVEALIAEMARYPSVPALSVAAERAGTVVCELTLGTASDPAQRFQAASISKVVTALAVLRLVADGRFGLDDDIFDLVEVRPLVSRNWTPVVTVRMVLGHRAGLVDDSGFPGYPVGTRVPTLEEILAGGPGVNSAPLQIGLVPGLQFRYSGVGYVLLQLLIERTTGRGFEDFVQEAVFDPAAMTHACFVKAPRAGDPGYAVGHLQGQVVPGGWHIYPELGAAGMWCTPMDLLRLHRAVTEFSPQALRHEMFGAVDGYGLGVQVANDGQLVAHSGGNLGYVCFMGGSPDGQYRLGLMTNGDDLRLLGRAAGLLARSIGWDGVPLPPEDEPPADTMLDDICGVYEGHGRSATLSRGPWGQPILTVDSQPPLPLSYLPPDFTAPGMALTLRLSGEAGRREMTIRQPGFTLRLSQKPPTRAPDDHDHA